MTAKPDHSSQSPFAYRGSTHIGLVLFLFALLYIKNAPLFIAGQFVSEDAFYFYETAYNMDLWSALSTPYAGYLHVLPMLLAELLWNLPFALLPWVNHVIALFFSVALLSWFYTPYCRNLLFSDRARAACVLILALTPYQPNLGMLLGLHWYLSFAIGLILLGDLPRRPTATAALACFLVLAAWSAPATVVLIPVALVRWWLWRKDPRRYIPLAFAAAAIAHALAIQFVFKPASPQPAFARLDIALEASFIMFTKGLLIDSIWGRGLADCFAHSAVLLMLPLAAGIAFGIYYGRSSMRICSGGLLIAIAGTMLSLAMLRGYQSALIVEAGEPAAERYLTTPGLYLWTGLFVLLAPWAGRLRSSAMRMPTIAALAGLCTLLIWKAPPLSGDRPLSEAFPHAPKARLLAKYEADITAGAQPETLALPGWTPVQCMRLKIGGGRACPKGESLACIFGEDLEKLGEAHYRVSWLGELKQIQGPWLAHNRWGTIAPIGYENGYYWFQDASGQRYLSGPAIYPDRFEYPLKNMIWVRRPDEN